MKLLRFKGFWFSVSIVSFVIIFTLLFTGNIEIPTFIKVADNIGKSVHLKLPPSTGRIYTLLIGCPATPKHLTGRGIALISNRNTKKQIDFDLSKCRIDKIFLSHNHLNGLVINTSDLGIQINIDSQFSNKDVTTVDLTFYQTPPQNLSFWVCFVTRIKYLPIFSKNS